MPGMFRVTFEIVTPESAEHGDAESRGFMLPGEWRVDVMDDSADVGMSLREALRLASPQEDSGAWFSEVDGRQDYRTGAVETRAIHPPRSVTAASYDRLARIILAR